MPPEKKSETKYREIADTLDREIREGRIPEGRPFSSENELAQRFSVSRVTVRQALSLLEQNGLIQRRQGKGTFVREEPRRYKEPGYNRIGIITSAQNGHVFDAIVSGAVRVLTAGNIQVQVMRSRERMSSKRECLVQMLSAGVDGLIIEGMHTALPNPNADIYREIESHGLPVVFTNSYHPDVHAAHVTANDREAVAGLLDHLASLGHTRIGGVFSMNQLQGLWRYQGFLDGLSRNRLEYVDERILFTSMNELQLLFDQRFNAAREKLEECTAMVCFNDEIARFLEATLLRSGIRVPESISVTGVDHILYQAPTGSILTTAAHPKEEMGASAARLVLQMLATGRDAENVELRMPFIQGSTTSPPERLQIS